MSDEGHVTDRLSAYVDGELDPVDRAEVERHVAVCAECADVVADLRVVVAEAAALPPVAPSRDLWPGIRGRLTPRAGARSAVAGQGRAAGRPVVRSWSRRHLTVSVPQLLAAGLAGAVLSGAAVWAALGGPVGAGSLALEGPGGPVASDVVLAAYEPGMLELEAEYQRRRTELDPETIHVVERNLAIIDAAIREASEALAADPSSGFLHTHLADAMRMRMTVLRQVASL